MLIVPYESKKQLREAIGGRLRYIETSVFSPEFRPDGTFPVSNRPKITGRPGREFFAEVTMVAGKIKAVK